MAEDTTYLCQQTWRNKDSAQLEASPLLTSIHDTGRCYTWNHAIHATRE